MKAARAAHRLGAHRLVGEPLASPSAVVGHLGAIQSQLHDMSLWAIGRRCGATLTEVSAAFDRGDFVRTHILRPTWHHVLPADLMDLIEVTAPRIRQLMTSNNRRDGLERNAIEHWANVAIEAIRDRGPLTRPEVEAVLTESGFSRQGNSMAHVMAEAELTGQIHNGPIRGKMHTYLGASLPPSGRTPDERLVWIAQTYGRGHGPFRDKDLAWWASMTLSQARRAITLADLEPVDLDGEIHFLVEPLSPVAIPEALLLPAFDEYISYARDPDDYALVDGEVGIVLRSMGLLFVRGALAGSWTRSVGTSEVQITVIPRVELTPAQRTEIDAESYRFSTFVERALDLKIN